MDRKPFFIASIFAISMGFFESAVVVYLREIEYPSGFSFPLHPLSGAVAITEILREVFSLLMLISVAALITRKKNERFAWFIFNFAIWDLSYYLFLKLLLGWPASFFTMDILFLIPFIWTGPVLAPMLVSVLMIILAVNILKYNKPLRRVKILPIEMGSLIIGSVIVVFSFTLDYLIYFFNRGGGLGNLFSMQAQQQISENFVPNNFNWIIFGAGFLVISFGILKFYLRNKGSRKAR